ncbi:magnesium/cobalt transporter CorA [Microcoleus sp. FACHB-831]|uniref:magnesium/cobalt transporter CorA n=1 Tax=Microcoleus sp. FACHB-831 TaxID=2692827 RepID=UPI001687CCE7|nr:magnesium/cobalt transporter CorA [Microcoleus sp. FACHB-831]MBD1924594.1 magnesium/cobalt transporter CorA [Microcoleus sp. FACHB-831]
MSERRPQPNDVFTKAHEEDDEDELFGYSYDQPGSIPGTIRLPDDAPPPKIILIDYNETNRTMVELESPAACAPHLDTESVSWVDVLGLGNKKTWGQMSKVFKLHPLVVEDVVNVPQRPKVEDYEEHLVIIAKMVMPKEGGDGFYSEQVSFVLGKHYLLTVQEEPDRDCFQPVRDRIRNKKGIIRTQGADYLAYALLDAIVDGFFPVLEDYGERLEALEDEVVSAPTRSTLDKIYQIKRELLVLRRAIWPQRDAINSLIRDGSNLISKEVLVYMRDCYDHAVQILDMVETYRELASGLMDVYLSSVGNRMNEVMKLLTVISSIFIPLTFIAGIYGMNFDTEKSPMNMPELNWYWGYPFCLMLMIVVATGLIYFFWRRGWFDNVSTIKDK